MQAFAVSDAVEMFLASCKVWRVGSPVHLAESECGGCDMFDKNTLIQIVAMRVARCSLKESRRVNITSILQVRKKVWTCNDVVLLLCSML